jgi:hypothetical protein
MGFADLYIHAMSASNLKDDALHHQVEPLTASAFAAAATGDLGPLLHRVKYASVAVQQAAQASAVRMHVEKELAAAISSKNAGREAECRQALDGDATAFAFSATHFAQLLQLWIAEVTKRGRARRWVPENTAWDAEAAHKLYRQVAEHSLAYWLDAKCEPCGGTGLEEKRSCKCCSGSGKAELMMAAGFVREHTLNMVSELQSIVDSHAARAASRLRSSV